MKFLQRAPMAGLGAYLIALAATGAAIAAGAALNGWLEGEALMLPAVMAVLVAAALGGLRPGLLATALCGAAFICLYLPSARGTSQLAQMQQAVGVALFLAICLTACTLCGALQAARRRLQRSEAFHRSIADLTSDFAFDAHVLPDGTTVMDSITEGFAKLLGYTLEEALAGGGWRLVLAPEERARGRDYMRRVQRGEDIEGEMRHVSKHGRSIWLHFQIHPVCNAGGRVERFYGAARDVTERREAERRIRQLNHELERRVEELQALFDVAPVAIWQAHDPACRRMTGNRYANQLLGVEPGIERDADGHAETRYLRDGRPVPDDELPLQQAARHGVPVHGVELEVVVPGREPAWVVGHSVPLLDAKGQVRGALGVFVDITQRKHVEAAVWQGREQLRLVADNAPVLIAHFDRAGRYKFVNRAYAQRFQLDPSEVVGRHVSEVIGEAAWARIRPFVERVLKGEPVTFEAEIPYAVFGSVHMRCAYAPERDAQGRVTGMLAALLNITDRKQAELALEAARAEAEHRAREAEQAKALLQTIFDNMPEGIVWVGGGPDYPVLANSRFGRELIGVPQRGSDTHPLDGYTVYTADASRRLRDEELPLYRASRHGETVCNEELLVERADGSRVSVLVDAAAIRNAQGEIIGAVNCWRDITERKRAEAAQRRSTERFRSLVLATTAIVWVTDAQGDFVEPQGSWEAYTGQDWATHRGKGWLMALHPDDRDRVRHASRTQRAQRGYHEIEARLWHAASGAYRYFQSRAVPAFDADGRISEWIGTCIDIHDRHQMLEALRQSEERFRLMVESAKDYAIFTLDAGGRVTAWNSGARNLLGYDEGDILGRHADLLYLHEDVTASVLSQELDRALRDGQAEAERQHRRKDGSTFWASGLVMPLSSGGEQRGFLKIMRDVTEAKHARETLERQARALQEADQRKDEFLATLAHELRNPLAPLRNCLEILRVAGGDPQAQAHARVVMERQLAQMVRLIDDLLDVSRISRGKITLQMSRVEVAQVVRDAIETSRPLIERAGHRLAVELPPQAVFVEADLTRLAQVFSNLLNNAAKYTEPGGEIRLRVESDGREARVSVRDNGVGISVAMLPRLFEMFSQGDRSIERSQGGLGIGLALVKRLVEMHGGSVEVRSEGLGHGSEFTVRLPLSVSQQAEAEPQRPGAAEPETAGRRMLVVDDNKDAAQSLAVMLQIMGNDTRVAHDGVEALGLAETFQPEIILLDIGMPRLNGYETARLMREQPWGRDALLVALTGWGQDEDRRRSREAGFDHHLVKPVEPEALGRLLLN
ncbi:PAS domain S-box protein [Caldimonas brevitalea]|uniref:histidine kinase n=1 Tax=Caldimonas brevitalea TaxID=413882 RepID=A0A0G3BJM7_9BURK|nr:PAS domain S-box protein [Caldimonas brevitalea]AKJ28188.1 chemotaxis protein methyltransferase CheR [Caldimonas brevitalea]